MKVCGRCKSELPLDLFGWKNKAKGWKQSYCKECNKQVNRNHYQNNKEDYAAKRDAYREEHGERMRALSYGLSLEELEALKTQHDGMCAICLENEAEHIDHCHATGRVQQRAWLLPG